jgi:hypothetical protein
MMVFSFLVVDASAQTARQSTRCGTLAASQMAGAASPEKSVADGSSSGPIGGKDR